MDKLTAVDFLRSEYQWCLSQYELLGYESYLARAKALENTISQYSEIEELMAA